MIEMKPHQLLVSEFHCVCLGRGFGLEAIRLAEERGWQAPGVSEIQV